jgi:serine/threonine protein kinase
VLAELVKVDLDYRWGLGLPKRLEQYLGEFPNLSTLTGMPCDLIYEEFQVRKRHGDPASPEEFAERFPERAAEIARLLGEKTSATRRKPGCPSDIEAGQQIDDFDLLTMVGDGAFAKVFLARQRSMQRLVALKISAAHGAEPQTLAQLDHAHIVRIYDQRLLPERDLLLLYMPYLSGGTLKEVIQHVNATQVEIRSGELILTAVEKSLKGRGEVPPTESLVGQRFATMTWPEAVCWLGARLADALQYAHQHGVLHRDLKPANVLLGADAAPRLADFNVSSCSKLDGAGPEAFFGGSIAYMSPEHLEALNPSNSRTPDSLDGRADIYSLAITLWELLTGARPFRDEPVDSDWPRTLAAMVEHRAESIDAERLAKLPPDMPAGLFEILSTCLQSDPDKRYHTAGELSRQLDLCRKPRARQLLLPKPGWRTWVARHPWIAVFAVCLLPNIVATWFSITYNRIALIEQYPEAREMFSRLQLIVNGLFFPLCMFMLGYFLWPIARGLRSAKVGILTPEELTRLRRHCLRLGPISLLVSVWAWIAAGVIFPLVLHNTVHELPLAFHLHFLASLTLCGLLAVSYPQFGVTFLALRCFYPALASNASLTRNDTIPFRSLDRSQSTYLMLAASVPMLAVGLLSGIGAESRQVLGVLSVVSIAGFIVASILTVAIRSDLAALEETTRD